MPVMEESNEILEKICGIRRSFDELVSRHSDDTAFADSVSGALDAADFLPEDGIRKEYAKGADSARLLRIGIVGAVKAGKSSLLNSLFFDGQDILPKAATPMTAALTEMTWGEKCSVTVDFFTDQDIDELKKRSAEYERRFNETKAQKVKDMEEAWRKAQKRRNPLFAADPKPEDRAKWEELSVKSARSVMKANMNLSGAWEQYQMISKSAEPRKTGSETFSVSSVSEISGRLEDYVGSEGKYMPFTSKVSIALPLEGLRGIAVVDTPGFNDPVPSRDERARLALRDCDAIFILSRATPFLTKTDMEVISKITQKNGLREIYIVPSQVDSTLMAPEHIKGSAGNMDTALESIRGILSGIVSRNLRDINDKGVFDQLITQASDRMFLTSGICESMSRTFADRDSWDSGKKNVWQNLCRNYPDFFSDSDQSTSIASLRKLGNTDVIRKSIDDVKSRKEDIFRERLQKFGSKYERAAEEARKSIISELEAREDDINKNDIGKTEALIKQLQDTYDTIAPELDDVFEDTVNEWYDSVKDEYQNRLSVSKGNVKEAMKAQEGEKTNEWTTKEESSWSNLFGLFAGDVHHQETVVTVNVNSLKGAIYDYVDDYNDFLPHFFNSQVRVLVKKIINNVQKVWIDKSNSDESASSFRNRVRKTLSGLVKEYDLACNAEQSSISSSMAEILGGISSLLSGGNPSRLEGRSAETFIEQSKEFVNELNRKFKGKLNDAIEDVYRQCTSCNFSKSVLDPYLEQLEKKKQDMEKPKLALESLKRMKAEVAAIK